MPFGIAHVTSEHSGGHVLYNGDEYDFNPSDRGPGIVSGNTVSFTIHPGFRARNVMRAPGLGALVNREMTAAAEQVAISLDAMAFAQPEEAAEMLESLLAKATTNSAAAGAITKTDITKAIG